MTAALNFLKNSLIGVGAFVVVILFAFVCVLAAIFHGINSVTAKR